MTSVNPASVRDEPDRLKHELTHLNKEEVIPSETKLLMHNMLTLLELVFAIFLEKNDPQKFQQTLPTRLMNLKTALKNRAHSKSH